MTVKRRKEKAGDGLAERRTECLERLICALALYAQDRVVAARFSLHVLVDVHVRSQTIRVRAEEQEGATVVVEFKVVAPDASRTFGCAARWR